MRFRNLYSPQTLRGQFSLALLALALLILAAGLTAVNALRSSAEISRQLAEERLEYFQEAQDLVQNTLLIERESYRMLTVDSQDDMQRSYSKIIKELASLDSLVVRLSQAHTDISVLTLHQASQLFRNTAHIVASLREQILEKGVSGDDLKTLHRFQEQLAQQVTVMTSAAGKLSDDLTRDYRERIGNLATTSKLNQKLVLGLVAISLFLALLISHYFLGRHVMERLQQVSRYLRTTSTQTEHIHVPVQGHDEIGSMARAVEKFLEDRRQLFAAQLSLRQNEEMMQAITESVQSSVLLVDEDDRIQFVNPATEALFGYHPEEMIGHRLHGTIFPEHLQQNTQAGLSSFRGTGGNPVVTKPVELSALHKNGTELMVLLNVGCVYKNDHWWAVVSIIDITERLAAEAELKRAQETRNVELQESQGALMNIVEDLNEKTTELEQANTKLKELDRLKSMFIASMSHELRTPLNSIIGFSSITLNEWTGPLNPEQKENIAAMLRSGKHLLSLINDVIDVSKIETGKIESIVEEFDVQEMVSEAVETMRGDIEKKGLELTVRACRYVLHTDRRRLLQCLLNLLSNAVKFTNQGSISIYAEPSADGSTLDIVVEDTGMGISEKDLGKLFSPFVRLYKSGESVIPGTGLGLYLTKKLLREILKGDIRVTSTTGAGSRFTIYVPTDV